MVNKQITVKPSIDDQLNRLRKKYTDEEGNPGSYSKIVKLALKKANLWKE
jgi:hypothetical protein